MSQVVIQKQIGSDNLIKRELYCIDLITDVWVSAYDVSTEDASKMRSNFDYDYINEKYGWEEN